MSQAVQLLLAEDDPGDAEVVKRLLAKSSRSRFEIHWADTLEAATQALAERPFDAVLLDLGLPPANELESLTKIRNVNAGMPIVVVTDLNVEAVALRALDHGAQDYLLKGALTTDGLVRSIHYATQRHRLVQNLADAQLVLERKNRRLAKLYRTAHQFVDNVSHEFRTPLTVIKEYVSLIKDGIVSDLEEQQKMLTIVEDRADDLNTMVDDMLDVSKLEAGLLGVYRKRCHPAAIVDHVRPALERKAAVKEIELEWEFAADLPEVYCDPEKAGRVLINLTVNAIKFCGEPGRVQIRCERDPERAGAVISVTDNGPGISADNQRKLFRRFQQLSETVRSSTKGFGLGLSIANELAGLNLGDIRVDSELGRGSTFSFSLPAADPAEVPRRYLQRLSAMQNGPPSLSLVSAEIAASADAVADEVDEFLSCLLRYNDLLLRVGATRWLIALPVVEHEVAAFQERTSKAISEANRNRLDGPLPAIDFQFVGTWPTRSHREILGRLRRELPCEELNHA